MHKRVLCPSRPLQACSVVLLQRAPPTSAQQQAQQQAQRQVAALAAAGATPGAGAQQQPQLPRGGTFSFKHFTLHHGSGSMRMGTDAMLLGSWAQPPPSPTAVLDAGTGSGVLALMMAQKTAQQQEAAVVVHAIDIDAAAVAQATANAAASPWADRLLVALSPLQAWAGPGVGAGGQQGYDLIITNPPFFLDSSKPGAAARAAARHADLTLPHSELAAAAARLLRPGGRLCLVLPVQEAGRFEAAAAQHGLLLTRLLRVFTKASDPQPKRHLMQFERLQDLLPGAAPGTSQQQQQQQPGLVQVESLAVMEAAPQQQQGGGQAAVQLQYSWPYQQLTGEFHHPDMFRARPSARGA